MPNAWRAGHDELNLGSRARGVVLRSEEDDQGTLDFRDDPEEALRSMEDGPDNPEFLSAHV